jgi:tripartite-type tricarboxylate transporter receptor subunit TctC
MKAAVSAVACFTSVLCVLGLPMHAAAQSAYPMKPVRMIAPFPPGGTTDVLGRIIAQKLGEALGRPVVVENRPGASGNIGHDVAAKAPADGYTLLFAAKGPLVMNQFLYRKMPFDPQTDFTPISLVAVAGLVLVIHPSVPARNVKELVALARARPGKMTFASGGIGSSPHIVGEVFRQVTGTRIIHVPYKGGGQAVTALVSGEIDMAFPDMAPSVPHVKSGRLRALAVTSEQRSSALPEVMTMTEAGLMQPFPQSWWALAGPKGMPAAVVTRVNAELGQILKLPDVQERLAALGVHPMHTTPERMMEIVKTETPQMARIIKAAGIEPE